MSMGQRLEDIDLALQIVNELGREAASNDCLNRDLLLRIIYDCVQTYV